MFSASAKNLRSIFLVGFLLTIALALTGYLDSSFIGTYVSLKKVGLLFSLGSFVSIALLALIPRFVGKLGVGGVFHMAALAYLVSILGMLYTESSLLFQALFVIYIAAGVGIYFCIDMLIEHFSINGSTGNTRGFYLAIYNLAYLVGPLLAGMLLKNNTFEMVYLMAGVFIIMMSLVYMRDFGSLMFRPVSKAGSFWRSFLRLSKNRDLRKVYFISLMLSFFFSWMSIYVPIYMNQFIGLGWDQIGAIFAIMHIPYVTLEIPFGRLADRCRCERELISAGLIITGLSTMLLATVTENSFLIWAVLLVITRIGASMIQVSVESYFFRRVTGKDSGLIAVFRNAGPVAYILGPLVATIFLAFVSYQYLFIILGIIMIGVVSVSARLHRGK